MPESNLERAFAFQIKAAKLPEPEREYRFHKTRRWRLDFFFSEQMLAVETEGGVWSGGRHVTGKGFTSDLEKYNEATLAGIRVLRFSSSMVDDGTAIATLERAFGRGG